VLTTSAFGGASEEGILRAWEPLATYRWLFNREARAGAPSTARTRPGLLRRIGRRCLVPDVQITWLPSALWQALRTLGDGKCDLIYTSFPPASAHLLGLLLKEYTDLPWVADFRDSWICDPLDPELVANPRRSAFEARLEEAVIRAADAVVVAKQYLSYFQGAVDEWEAPDPRELRYIVPQNRLRYYDMRDVVQGLADVGSVLEIRRHWGPGIITAFIRVEGKPLGVIANNPGHLSGAVDAQGADKGARFMQLCDAFDIPILTLCDCPGIMVGPESEKTALVRHAGRMFVVGSNIDVPLMTIVIRKGYGLGAQAMAGGSFHAPLFTVSWPTGEFGGMGLEGAVKLGYRKELQAIEDPDERKEAYDQMVADMYKRGKGVNMASHFELDEVIDPADSRKWIAAGLRSLPPPPRREGKKRPNVDTW